LDKYVVTYKTIVEADSAYDAGVKVVHSMNLDRAIRFHIAKVDPECEALHDEPQRVTVGGRKRAAA
jgi:hypothetical protein